jgi:hypothetical protein
MCSPYSRDVIQGRTLWRYKNCHSQAPQGANSEDIMLCSMLRTFHELVLVEGRIADESGRFLALRNALSPIG